MAKIRIDWQQHVNSLTETPLVEDLLQQYPTVFQEELGHLKGIKAHISMPATAQPHFFRPRPVTFPVEAELERLQNEGIITPVQYSDWAAPLVPVLKSDGQSIRLCGDYKVTVNREALLDSYLLPE